MRFGLLILAQGLALAGLAAQLGGWGWLLAWPAVASVVVAVAYLADWTWIFGKRADGSLRWLPHLLLGPFLWATWAVWHLARRLGREPASHEVVPGLWLGRRPFLEELPPGCALVVDMTAEFPAHKAILAGVPYVCIPTLDGTPPAAELEAVLQRIDDAAGPVYIHCAAGHGRSATLAACVLIRRGLAHDVHEAQARLRASRPSVRLHRAQRARVAAITGTPL